MYMWCFAGAFWAFEEDGRCCCVSEKCGLVISENHNKSLWQGAADTAQHSTQSIFVTDENSQGSNFVSNCLPSAGKKSTCSVQHEHNGPNSTPNAMMPAAPFLYISVMQTLMVVVVSYLSLLCAGVS